MSKEDENHFTPRPGRIRADMPTSGQAKSFLSRVRKIARQQGAPAIGSKKRSGGSGPHGTAGGARPHGKPGSGRGVQRGRGAAFVRSRTLGRGWSHRQPGARRVVVKARSVRQAWAEGRAVAHLRYIQRDGTSRDGERGQLYGATHDRADGDAFLERAKEDRHQFRFIVSPEDATELEDLNSFTRDLMRQIEADLGTQLDWVAVNHFNTGHPHVHIIVNGHDEWGEDLVINGDYIAQGIRERASERVTLELGPVTELEQQRKLTAEIGQDRFTRIDRALIDEAGGGVLDLRSDPNLINQRNIADRALRLGRLGKLETMGLATQVGPRRWRLSARLESTLRELGERGDIIRTMQKALAVDGHARDPMSFEIHDAVPRTPIIGRVVDKHLADELGETLSLIVDGIDGRTHRVPGFDPARVAEAGIGSIVEISPADRAGRPSDRTIAAIAEDGIYRPSRHLEQAKFEGRVPGNDIQGFVEAHVRRLEALRRAGIVEWLDADQWRLPKDFIQRAADYDASRNREANLRVLSRFDLNSQISADGATWLDRRLFSRDASDLAPSGFGAEVQQAMARRREHLIEQGDAIRQEDGRIAYRRGLLAVLQEREVARIGAKMAPSRGVPFRAGEDGETIQGTFKETVQLASGKFALVENAHEFTLVPWRAVIERQLGREVMGIVEGGSISWQMGRRRGLGL